MDPIAQLFANPLVLAGALVVALILLGWLLRPLLRWWFRRRETRAIEEIVINEIEAPSEKDIRAYQRLRELRRDIWTKWGDEQSLSPRALYDLAFEVTGTVAAIYHPDTPEPQYKASVDGLLDLNQRVISRLRGILDKPVIRSLRGLDVATIMTLKRGVDVVRTNPVSSFFLKPKVRAMTRGFFDVLNALNPVHWARRIVVDAGFETARRYFVTSLVTIVGEEAVLLYSGRRTRNETAAREQVVLTMLARAIALQGATTAEELALFQRWLLRLHHLDAAVRMDLLAAVHSRKAPAAVPTETIVAVKAVDDIRRALSELAALPAADRAARMRSLSETERALSEEVPTGKDARQGNSVDTGK